LSFRIRVEQRVRSTSCSDLPPIYRSIAAAESDRNALKEYGVSRPRWACCQIPSNLASTADFG
jgi:hypothetical protein